MKKTIIVLCLFLAAIYLALSYYFSSIVLEVPRRTETETIKNIKDHAGVDIMTYRNRLPKGEDFTANSKADDLTIKGTYFEQDTTRCAVVFAHGYGSTRISMMKYAHIFWECGCDVAVFDQRGHGESDIAYATGGVFEGEDVQTVSNWLKNKTSLTNEYIGWMGSSWGGAAVLQAAASDDDVAFVIANATFQNWETAVFERAKIMYGSWIGWLQPGVWAMVSLRTGTNAWSASALEAAPKIKEPVLLFHSQADAETASYQSVNIAKLLDPDNSQFHHLDWGSPHGQTFYKRPAEYRQLVLDFITEYVPHWSTVLDCNE